MASTYIRICYKRESCLDFKVFEKLLCFIPQNLSTLLYFPHNAEGKNKDQH